MPLIRQDELIDSLDATAPFSGDASALIAPEEKPISFLDDAKNIWKSDTWIGQLTTAYQTVDDGTTPVFSGNKGSLDEQEEQFKQKIVSPEFSQPSKVITTAMDNKRENPQYDWWSQIKGTEHEKNWQLFQYADNDEEFNYAVHTSTNRNATTEGMSRASTTKNVLASIAAGLMDPLNLIPVVGMETKALSIGQAVARGATVTAAYGAGQATFNEAALTRLQPGNEFSPESVAAASLIGGILGGALGGVTASIGKNIAGTDTLNTITKIFEDGKYESTTLPPTWHSVGAAETGDLLGDTRLAGFGRLGAEDTAYFSVGNRKIPLPTAGRIALPIPVIFDLPKVRGLSSENVLVRQLTERVFNTGEYLTKNTQEFGSTAPSAEILDLGRPRVDAFRVLDRFDQTWLDINKSFSGVLGQAKAAITSRFGEGGITNAKLREEVAFAMRRGDTSDIPQVAALSKEYRQIQEHWHNELKENGLLDYDVHLAGDSSYLSRVWNAEKIRSNRNKFVEDITKVILNKRGPGSEEARLKAIEYAETRIKDLEEDFSPSAREAVAGFIKDIEEYKNTKEIDPDEAYLLAEQLADYMNKVSGKDLALSSFNILSAGKGASILKHRALAFIDDREIEDWLINDGPALIQMYVQQAGKQINFKKSVLDVFGAKNTNDVKEAIARSYDSEFAAAKEAKTGTGDISARQNAAVTLADDIMRVHLGQYSTDRPGNTLRFLMTHNFVTKMGYYAFSSANDLLVSTMRHGLPAQITKGYLPAIVNTFLPAVRAAKKQDMQDLAVALETMQDDMLRQLFEVAGDSQYRIMTPFEKWVNGVSRTFTVLSLARVWNRITRSMVLNVSQYGLIRNLKRAMEGVAKAQREVRSLGISDEKWGPLLQQIEKYGEERGLNTWISNVDHWSDQGLRDVYTSAILTDLNAGLQYASKGEIPFWAQKNSVFQEMYQFKNFFGAASVKILLNAAQRRDFNTASYIIGAVALSALQGQLRAVMQGKDDYPKDIGFMIQDGFSRSGLFGLMTDPIFGAIANYSGYSQGSSRYYKQNMAEYVIGPTASTLNTLFNTASSLIKNGKLSASEEKALIRLIPFNNIFYLDALIKRTYGDSK